MISSCQSIPENPWLLGIDFPIWFNTPEEKPKIIILGIDPLRNESTFKSMRADREKNVIIGTPYTLNCARMRNGRQRNYWTLINNLSEKNFVYLTDVYKTFFYISHESKRKEDQRSYDYYKENNFLTGHKKFIGKGN